MERNGNAVVVVAAAAHYISTIAWLAGWLAAGVMVVVVRQFACKN
jgi:hypothetical protein